MTYAAGPFKKLAVNEEVTFGTMVAAGGIYLDRTDSTVDLTKAIYNSTAIRTDQQYAISRHGMHKVGGQIKGELNPGAYPRLIQAILRRDFAAGVSTGAQTTMSATSAVGFARSAGSFLTDGFKIGRVIQAAGFTNSANNTRRFLVTAVTATNLSLVNCDGTTATITTEAAGASVTISEVGKSTWIPSTGQTDKSFSVEHWFSDIGQSEVFVGTKFSALDVQLPTTGLCVADFTAVGKDVNVATSQQLTTPTTAVAGTGLASVNGVVLVQGAVVGILNSLQFKVDGQMMTEGVVGSNTSPFVWAGQLKGSGQFTAFFQDATFRDYFRLETEISIVALLTTSNVAAPDFMGFTLPRCKVNGATKDDKQTGGLKLTGTLEFLRNTAGGAGTSSDDTTIVVQDSLA